MSYNGYKYANYYNSSSQGNNRQGNRPAPYVSGGAPSHPVPSQSQQQNGIRSITANQTRHSNEQELRSTQPSPDQWYMSGNVTSAGGYHSSAAATAVSGSQAQYIGQAGRDGASHIDTSALGSLAYASGLESSGAGHQLMQMNRRIVADNDTTQRRIETPSARLVSPMRGSSGTAIPNRHNSNPSEDASSAKSGSLFNLRESQQHTQSGYGNSSPAAVNYETQSSRPAASISGLGDLNHYRCYPSNPVSELGGGLPRQEPYDSGYSTRQTQPLLPQRRASTTSGSQLANPTIRTEQQRWQTDSNYRVPKTRSPDNNVRDFNCSTGVTQGIKPSASKSSDPAMTKVEAIPAVVPQSSGYLARSAHLSSNMNGVSNPNIHQARGIQDTPSRMGHVRQGQRSEAQEHNGSRPQSPVKLGHHIYQDQSPAAAHTAPITVDPSRVFNPYHQEYQRRKALADAEEANNNGQIVPQTDDRMSGSASAPNLAGGGAVPQDFRLAPPIPKDGEAHIDPQLRSTIGGKGIATAQHETGTKGASSGSGSGDKEGMEADMRLMLEKMREYKSKDPSLFLQIWEQVKKVCFTATEIQHLSSS